MTTDLNNFTFNGRLVADAKIKKHENETITASFTVASNYYSKNSETGYKTNLFYVENNYCKIPQALKKSQLVSIIGEVRQYSVEKDGEKTDKTKIIAHKIQLLNG